MEIFGYPMTVWLSQLLLGLVNGSFYAMLSLGLAVIFGLLNVINFSHGALYMMGAFVAWMGMRERRRRGWMRRMRGMRGRRVPARVGRRWPCPP